MNKQTKLLLAVLVVAGIAYYIVSKKPWRTAEKASNAFAVEDTASITKIFMANKRGEKVLLERLSNNDWQVNGAVLAEQPKIQLLLSTLKQMQIQMPIPSTMHNTAIGILATKGIKTEIYAGDKLLKTIYVGSETPDKTGTFMLLEGDEEVYSVHIPGFVGYLTPRFFITEIKWRSKLVFNFLPQEIESYQIQYFKNPEESFTIQTSLFASNQSILNGKNESIVADSQQVKIVLHSFQNKYVEGYYDDSTFTPAERDSLFKLEPYCKIQLKSVQGKLHELTFYEKPVGDRTKERYDDQGNELEIDPEKFYVKINDIPQIASIQEYAFRTILSKLSKLKKK